VAIGSCVFELSDMAAVGASFSAGAMNKPRFSEEQTVTIFREADAKVSIEA